MEPAQRACFSCYTFPPRSYRCVLQLPQATEGAREQQTHSPPIPNQNRKTVTHHSRPQHLTLSNVRSSCGGARGSSSSCTKSGWCSRIAAPVGWCPKKRHPAGQDNFSSISQAFSLNSKETIARLPLPPPLPPLCTELLHTALHAR
jgi:hypothetical protein